MDPLVFAAVLFAAACHAGWNATIKGGLDPLATTVLISISAAIVAAAFFPLVGLPAGAAWPWCGASVLIHLIYFAALIESYRAGDLGQVYPIARGSAPLMTAIVTTALVGERLSIAGWSGIILLVGGVILLSLRGGRDLTRLDCKASDLPCLLRGRFAPIRWWTAWAPGAPEAPLPIQSRFSRESVRSWRSTHSPGADPK
jgi:drug/metabolite transporter (DMT)-like permease